MPTEAELRKAAVDKVKGVVESNDVTLLMDGFHLSSNNGQFVYSKQLVDALAVAGVKNFCIEIEKDPYQKIFEKYLSTPQKISLEGLVISLEYMLPIADKMERGLEARTLAGFIKYANAKGIKVHPLNNVGGATLTNTFFVNNFDPKNDLTVKQMKSVLEEGIKDANHVLGLVNSEVGVALNERQISIQKKSLEYLQQNFSDSDKLSQIKDKLIDGQYKERLELDISLAKEISDISKNGKTAAYFGALHGCKYNGINGKDLDEHLEDNGVNKIGRVLMAPSREQLEVIKTEYGVSELPEMVIITNPRKIEVLELSQKQAPVNSKPLSAKEKLHNAEVNLVAWYQKFNREVNHSVVGRVQGLDTAITTIEEAKQYVGVYNDMIVAKNELRAENNRTKQNQLRPEIESPVFGNRAMRQPEDLTIAKFEAVRIAGKYYLKLEKDDSEPSRPNIPPHNYGVLTPPVVPNNSNPNVRGNVNINTNATNTTVTGQGASVGGVIINGVQQGGIQGR